MCSFFSFNLIFVSKLTSDSSCCLVFFPNSWLIWGLSTWTTIRMGEEKVGLYQRLQTLLFCCFVLSSVNQNLHLWHYKLGHIPFSNMNFLNNSVLPHLQITKPLDTYVCTIRPLAKQRCFSFPFSETISYWMFDLIHCDLGIHILVFALDDSKLFLTIVDIFQNQHGSIFFKIKHKLDPTFSHSLIGRNTISI